MRVRSAVVAAALAVGVLAVAAPSASADGGGGTDGQVSGSANGGTLAVHVSYSGTAVGNGGVTSSNGSSSAGSVSTVYTPPACYWDGLGGVYTGKSFYEYSQTQAFNQRATVGSEAMYFPTKEAIAAHKDDDGTWYTIAPGPRSTIGDDRWWDGVTSRCMSQLRKGAPAGINGGNAGYLFVPAGTNPPQPLPQPPTVQQLRDLAEKALTLPEPQLAQNPPGRSLVSVPTWFWIRGGNFRTWSITATAGQPANSATVTATPAGWAVTGGGQSKTCSVQQATTSWSRGEADSAGCSISFAKSSIGQPGDQYTVTGRSTYDTGWTSTIAGAPGPGGPLADPQVRTGQTQLPVAEVQSLVTSS